MRDSFHHLKWILIAVVAAFIFGFVFLDMGLGGAIGGSPNDNRVFAARVNGETITLQRLLPRAARTTRTCTRRCTAQQFTPRDGAADGSAEAGARLPRRPAPAHGRKRERLNLDAIAGRSPQEAAHDPDVHRRTASSSAWSSTTRYVTGRLGYPSAADVRRGPGPRDHRSARWRARSTSSIVVSPKAAEAEYRRMNENAKIRYVLLPAVAAGRGA